MPRVPSLSSLAKLPQTSETWQIAIAQLRTWIAPPDEVPRRPYAIFIFNNDDGSMMFLDLAEYEPEPDQVRDALFKTMAKPAREVGPPRLPETIIVPDPDLAEALAASLAEARLGMTIIEQQPPTEFQEIVRELEASLRGDEPEHPGLLSVKGVTPELVGSVFAAAAEFYRAAPWIHLNNSQVLAVRHPAEPNDRYAAVMGNGGVEYGLATYLRWADVERMHSGVDDPMEALPESGAHSLFYDSITRLAFDDLDALEKYGWEVAGEDAYPIPVIYDKKIGARRPELIDMLWYEAALRAIPIFVRDHLKPDGRGDYQPIEKTIEVATHAGPLKVDVKYPAGELPPAARPAQDIDWADFEDTEDDSEAMPFFDRRGMEGILAQMGGQMGGAGESGDPNLDRAQRLMYQAWEETNPAKRIALAHQALSISPNCADAYVLLAEEEADTVGRALEYYQQGVTAGEHALGPEYFREYAGDFWGLLETRPYMRAREGLAETLWRLNRKDEAVEHYRDMLRLNPNDNQGVRYVLLDLLLLLDREDDVSKLIRKYRDDWSSVWRYTNALLEFRKSAASAQARKALNEAFKQNPHVPAYLTGKKRIPNRLPDTIGLGDENEAISYAANHLNHWRRTPGAVDWLIEQMETRPAPPQPRPAARRKRAGTARVKGKARNRDKRK